MRSFLLSVMMLCALASGPRAEQPLDDEVVLSLSVEGWARAAMPNLQVLIEAGLPEDQAPALRARVDETLKAIAGGAPWRVTGVDRRVESTGLTTYRVRAEARVEDAVAAKAGAAVQPLSKPGFAVRLSGVDHTPSLAETQALEADLRARIYGLATQELQRLAAQQPDRHFRLRRIEFLDHGVPMPRAARAEAMMAAPADAAPEPAPLAVSRRLILRALVVLGSTPPNQ